MSEATAILENPAKLPVRGHYDVVIAGGGPAGIAAAIAAGRSGAKVCLIEHQGMLGGIWTAGLLTLILDSQKKPGLIVEIRNELKRRDAIEPTRDLYDAETMKLVLEELCAQAGVEVRLYTRLVSAQLEGRRMTHVIVEAKEGRFALAGDAFIDTTGDGDLAARAGCQFDLGRAEDSLSQPMSLLAMISGVPESIRSAPFKGATSGCCVDKDAFYRLLVDAGCTPSYTKPSLFPLSNGLCCIMSNHIYEKSALKSEDLTAASIQARKELHEAVAAMRKFPGGEWSEVQLVASAAHIGVREGRRIRGRFHITLEDLLAGRKHDDAVTRVTFPIDVHSMMKSEGGGYGRDSAAAPSLPYDIPLRALIAADVDNLAMAGRCISGDFHAHASYRVTGNAVTTGEAAGIFASHLARSGKNADSYDASKVLTELEVFRQACEARACEPGALV